MYVNNESLLQKDPLASSEMSLHIFFFQKKIQGWNRLADALAYNDGSSV